MKKLENGKIVDNIKKALGLCEKRRNGAKSMRTNRRRRRQVGWRSRHRGQVQ